MRFKKDVISTSHDTYQSLFVLFSNYLNKESILYKNTEETNRKHNDEFE